MEAFFDRFAAVAEGANIPDAFRRIGGEVGMRVVGPPLAISDSLEPEAQTGEARVRRA